MDHGLPKKGEVMSFGRHELERALEAGLPGVEAHLQMLPPGREFTDPRQVPASARESGVLVLLFPIDGKVHTCLLKRPGHMKVHAGQVGFPGGSREPGDTSTLETSLREAHEETGVEISILEIVTPLTPLYVPVSGFMIYPYLAWSSQIPRFTPQPSEVEKILLYPLPSGTAKLPVTTSLTHTVTGWREVPSLPFEGEIIWGATAMILSEVAGIIALIKGTSQPSGPDEKNAAAFGF